MPGGKQPEVNCELIMFHYRDFSAFFFLGVNYSTAHKSCAHVFFFRTEQVMGYVKLL